MPRVVLCLFLTVFPLSLFATGHDTSSIRYAPSDLATGPAVIAYNGSQFLTLWPMSLHLYGSLADASGRSLSPAIVVSEIAPPIVRGAARLYLMSKLTPMPAAPPAPRNVVTYVTETTTIINWESGTQAGFLIEGTVDFGKTWFPFATVLDMRSVTLAGDANGILFRVSAIGPGGFSEPVVSTIGSSVERRRAARR